MLLSSDNGSRFLLELGISSIAVLRHWQMFNKSYFFRIADNCRGQRKAKTSADSFEHTNVVRSGQDEGVCCVYRALAEMPLRLCKSSKEGDETHGIEVKPCLVAKLGVWALSCCSNCWPAVCAILQ